MIGLFVLLVKAVIYAIACVLCGLGAGAGFVLGRAAADEVKHQIVEGVRRATEGNSKSGDAANRTY